ncbi:MAG TPA: CPBP family intramembrane glutamic endopeptidase [Bryobacteraceae bacterium]|jgi:membrane protease YdiL (CAAX protease family)|nr:CPBP family intramembrane glutamic endopeptidase [Bryobacteraceae bacterium]
MSTDPGPRKPDKIAVAVRVIIYAFLAFVGWVVFPALMLWTPGMKLVAAALGVFVAAAVANAVVLRIYEHGQLADIGLGWTNASRRNLLLGVAGGGAAAVLVVIAPVALRIADFTTTSGFGWPSVLFVSLVLLFGAAGEEILFRGYAFQVLVGVLGPFATILPFGVLFAVAHLLNPNQTLLSPVNTALWGVLLGYAFLRSGDLWLPIGLHFGWNWLIALLGAPLSGFTMSVTGLTVHWRVGELWSGGAYGPEGGLFTTLALIGVAIYLNRAPIEQQTAVVTLRSAGSAP